MLLTHIAQTKAASSVHKLVSIKHQCKYNTPEHSEEPHSYEGSITT